MRGTGCEEGVQNLRPVGRGFTATLAHGTGMTNMYRMKFYAAVLFASAWACTLSATAREAKPGHEEGEFRVLVAGKEIGVEKYIIVSSSESSSSSSSLDFRNPGEARQKVHFETKLDMAAHYVPRAYELRSDVDGKKGSIIGEFRPNQALFEYGAEAPPKKSGLLVGDQYTILDTNIFHHFVFLARLFDFGSQEKTQKFQVVIPQETDSGIIKISDGGRTTLIVEGRKVPAHRLLADTGSLQMELWVDDKHVLHKIVVQARNLEVVRRP